MPFDARMMMSLCLNNFSNFILDISVTALSQGHGLYICNVQKIHTCA